MIATYSSLAMVSSAVIYLLAMCAYALEWAAIRRPADTAPGEEAAVSPRASRFGPRQRFASHAPGASNDRVPSYRVNRTAASRGLCPRLKSSGEDRQ